MAGSQQDDRRLASNLRPEVMSGETRSGKSLVRDESGRRDLLDKWADYGNAMMASGRSSQLKYEIERMLTDDHAMVVAGKQRRPLLEAEIQWMQKAGLQLKSIFDKKLEKKSAESSRASSSSLSGMSMAYKVANGQLLSASGGIH